MGPKHVMHTVSAQWHDHLSTGLVVPAFLPEVGHSILGEVQALCQPSVVEVHVHSRKQGLQQLE